MSVKQLIDDAACKLRSARKEAGMEEYILPGIIGGGLGALVGSDRREMLRNAILGALAGIGAKYGHKALTAQSSPFTYPVTPTAGAAGAAGAAGRNYKLEAEEINARSAAEHQQLQADRAREQREMRAGIESAKARLRAISDKKTPSKTQRTTPKPKPKTPPKPNTVQTPVSRAHMRGPATARPNAEVAPLYKSYEDNYRELRDMGTRNPAMVAAETYSKAFGPAAFEAAAGVLGSLKGRLPKINNPVKTLWRTGSTVLGDTMLEKSPYTPDNSDAAALSLEKRYADKEMLDRGQKP